MALDRGRGRLIGRRRELGVLERALEQLSSSAARWVVLRGEPGVGKTRLLGELQDRADEQRHLVLSGRGAEFERELPFGVWIDALDDHVGSIGPQRLHSLVGQQVHELARVLPAVRASAGADGVALQDERYRAHRAVRALLERLTVQHPLVVVLDDLQWADDASLELVAHLLRRPVSGPLLVAVAFRAGQLPPSLLAVLEAAERDDVLTDMRVESLSAVEADAFLGERLPAAVRARLYEQTGGNPFYLEQLASLAVRVPAALVGLGEHVPVPEAVVAALGQQVAGLSEHARLLAWGAAVAGEAADLDLVASTAGIEEDLALEGVDELLACDLLGATEVPRHYRFRHPIVRRAVYEAAGEAWRLRAHARAAAALATRRGSVAARAHHLERCARVGDEEAIGVLVEAGREAASRAPAGAAQWFAAALRLMAQDGSAAPRRLELLMPLASALASAGRLEQALTALLDALALVPPDFAAGRVRLIGACAACENLLGRHDAAHARLLSALEDLSDDDSADAATLQAELAVDALYDNDFAAMRDWAQRALAPARAQQDGGLTVLSAGLACFADYALGHLEPARNAQAEAAMALDAMSDGALAARLDGAYYLGFAEFFCERYDDAIRHLQRGIAVSRMSGQGQFLAPMMVGLAHAMEVRGRLAEALETAESAVEAARLADNRQVIGWALVAEAWIAAMGGHLERAVRACEEALSTIEGLDESVLTRAAREHVAAVWIEVGDPVLCLEQARVAGAPEFLHVEPGRRAWLYALLVRAELARGEHAAAAEWLGRAETAARGLDLPLTDAAVLHAQALVVLHDDRPQEAAELARRAAERADAVGAVLQRERSRTLLASALARAGNRTEAAGLLREAEAQFLACGAQRLRDEALRELRRLGLRSTARQRRGPGGEGFAALTGREREICELVARGYTNREIAAQVFLSAKTVEGHLTNIFAKLRVGSRAEVAEAVGRTRTTEA